MSERTCTQCSGQFTCRADAKTRYCSSSCKGMARRGSIVKPDLRAEIIRLYTEELLSGERIAPLLGMTLSNVYLHLKRAGVTLRGRVGGPRVARACENCGAAFEATTSLGQRGNTRFCSRGCAETFRIPLARRFWPKVKKTDTCWLWTGSTNRLGYGQINAGKANGHPISTHRAAWELTNGAIPEGQWVLHNCPGGDNPSCVNPAHLWLGTARDNARDMAVKGRHWRQRK